MESTEHPMHEKPLPLVKIKAERAVLSELMKVTVDVLSNRSLGGSDAERRS